MAVDLDRLFDKLDDALDGVDTKLDGFDDLLSGKMDDLDRRLRKYAKRPRKSSTQVIINGEDVTKEWIRKGKIKDDGSHISINNSTISTTSLGFAMGIVGSVVKWGCVIAMICILWWGIQFALTPQVSKNPAPMNPPAAEETTPRVEPKAL